MTRQQKRAAERKANKIIDGYAVYAGKTTTHKVLVVTTGSVNSLLEAANVAHDIDAKGALDSLNAFVSGIEPVCLNCDAELNSDNPSTFAERMSVCAVLCGLPASGDWRPWQHICVSGLGDGKRHYFVAGFCDECVHPKNYLDVVKSHLEKVGQCPGRWQ